MEAGHALSSRLGRITIASEAIAQIVAETALECYGVVGMKGSLRGQLARARDALAGSRSAGRRRGDVDLHVVVEYGLNLAEVASSVRNRVAYEVERLTGLPVRAVEVHVDDVRTAGMTADGPRPRARLVGAALASLEASRPGSTISTSIPVPTATPAPTSR